MRLLQLMISSLVPIDDEKWHIFLNFSEIIERLCMQEFANIQLNILENPVTLFFTEYQKKFPDESLKLKAHFLQHYPKMIKRFGPLVKTLGENGYFKTVFHCTKNRKNVCFTLVKRHQILIYLHYQKSDLL